MFIMFYLFVFKNFLIPKTLESNKKIEDTNVKVVNQLNLGEDHLEGKRELSQGIANIAESRAREDIYNFNFIDAVNKLESTISDYSFESLSNYENLKNIQIDLIVMSHFEQMLERNDVNRLKDSIRNLNDLENFFISVMWLDRANREDLIFSNESINPIFDGGIRIIDKRKINKNEKSFLSRVDTSFSDIQDIYEVEFEIENNELLAYIIVNNDRYVFYNILEKNKGSTHYLTIKEWEKAYQNTFQNNSSNTKNFEGVEELDNEMQSEETDILPSL